MLPRQFLIKMAHAYGLSLDQEDVFLRRFADGKDYPEIAQELNTSQGACLKRMGQVYNKFAITGRNRGKENQLRNFLTDQYESNNLSLGNTLKLPVFKGIRREMLIIYSDQEPDVSLAIQLQAAMSQTGQIVYMADNNPEKFQANLKQSDYCLILLSEQYSNSELLIEQIREVKELQQASPEKKNTIIVIGVEFSQDWEINYNLRLLLEGVPQLEWRTSSDTPTIIHKVCNLLQETSSIPASSTEQFTVFNSPPKRGESLDGRPLPIAGPNLPEGQVELDSNFYIERPPIEENCYETVKQPGSLISIKAPRQMGKTSLMTRILNHAKKQEYETIYLTLQIADKKVFKDSEKFLKWFCVNVGHQLNLPNKLKDYWDEEYLGNKVSCTSYFEEYILEEIDRPIVLGIDELDFIFSCEEIYQDFLSLLRAWHEKGKNHKIWKKIRFVLAYSKETYIPLDLNQSPFNVGTTVVLPEFTKEQILDLANRYKLDLKKLQIEQLINLLGGHPYLIRLALYYLSLDPLSWETILETAPTESGIYTDHLRRHWWNIQQYETLTEAMKKVVSANNYILLDPKEGFQLSSIGLIKWTANQAEAKCDLYRQYFQAIFEIC